MGLLTHYGDHKDLTVEGLTLWRYRIYGLTLVANQPISRLTRASAS